MMERAAPDPIAWWICDELLTIYPDNPHGTVTDLINLSVLRRLAARVRHELEVVR
jgi:hypothetical protein